MKSARNGVLDFMWKSVWWHLNTPVLICSSPLSYLVLFVLLTALILRVFKWERTPVSILVWSLIKLFMNPMPSWFVCVFFFFFSDVLTYCVMLQAFICYCSFVRCFWCARARVCVLFIGIVQRNWACLTWKSALEIKSLLLLLVCLITSVMMLCWSCLQHVQIGIVVNKGEKCMTCVTLIIVIFMGTKS